jgi:hypothetical protein
MAVAMASIEKSKEGGSSSETVEKDSEGKSNSD